MKTHRDIEALAADHLSEGERFAPAAMPARLRPEARKVLVVEDERRLREMLLISIREMGWDPTGATSAENALRLLEQHDFAIAVVDLNLPGIDGLELCERIRPRSRAMQFVILTGFGNLDFARRAIRVEVADFLIKPCRMDELESAIERAHARWVERVDPLGQAQPEPSSAESHSRAASTTTAAAADPVDPVESIEAMERRLILAALARHHGSREAAAAELGISVRKLYYRLQQYQK